MISAFRDWLMELANPQAHLRQAQGHCLRHLQTRRGKNAPLNHQIVAQAFQQQPRQSTSHTRVAPSQLLLLILQIFER